MKRVVFMVNQAVSRPHHLSLEEYGALIRLVMFASQRGFVLDDDNHRLARIVGVDVRVWKRIRKSIHTFWIERNGKLMAIGSEIVEGKRRPIPASTRALVLRRDGKRCRYCSTTSGPFELDHILPRSRGGSDKAENLVVACHNCNAAKSDRTPEEMGWSQ